MTIGARPTRQQITTGIFCLESWSGNLTHRSTVRPLLELLEAQAGVKFIHRVVDASDAFFDLLGRWPSYRGYRLGYIACHGERETLRIGSDTVQLSEITDGLKERGVTLRGKTLYFGSCAVLAMPRSRLTGFRKATGAQAVCGYRGDEGVEWLESAAFELICSTIWRPAALRLPRPRCASSSVTTPTPGSAYGSWPTRSRDLGRPIRPELA